MPKFQALTNLSIPQSFSGSDPANTRQTDLVRPGEIVELTEQQAQAIQRNHRVPVIRPAKEQNDPVPPYVTQRGITGRALFNGTPRAEQFGARPDPAGSTQLLVPAAAQPVAQGAGEPGSQAFFQPEANDPRPGDEQVTPDAIDIPPRVRRGAAAARQGAPA